MGSVPLTEDDDLSAGCEASFGAIPPSEPFDTSRSFTVGLDSLLGATTGSVMSDSEDAATLTAAVTVQVDTAGARIALHKDQPMHKI